MGIVLQFQSLPPDRRQQKTQPDGYNPKQNTGVAEIVIFPGIRRECDFANKVCSAVSKHRMTGELPAE